jgi:signal transduction histidine kinase
MAVVGTLAAGMAHEIRNPITTIKIFSEFLKEKKDDPQFIAKFEKLVPKEVEKINHMIVHLLEFSRPADYKNMEEVDLKSAVDDALDLLENQMALNDIVLKEDIGDIPQVSGNQKYIQEILFNLINNSIHAIGRRGTITIEARESGSDVALRVKDTGCGIPEDQIEQIFEPFFTTKMDSKGVGLGLYVIKQLMTRMDGKISVESVVGEGTTFTLEFPAQTKGALRV